MIFIPMRMTIAMPVMRMLSCEIRCRITYKPAVRITVSEMITITFDIWIVVHVLIKQRTMLKVTAVNTRLIPAELGAEVALMGTGCM